DSLSGLTETELTLEKLAELGLTKKKGLLKILGNGEITTAITIHAHKFSKSAQEKIERAGGKAIVVGEARAQA
ncbi:MAG: large subunit ribosomal protein, partial [Acidobacteriaceae bacterium]|nr:large subunit ribosomal protein [Acidobacteriaceae bacterium]